MTKPTKSNPVIVKKPDVEDRCYVTVRDGRTKKSKGMTVYGIRPEQLLDLIRQSIEDKATNPEANAA